MQLTGRVGPGNYGDGADADVRLGNQGELVSALHGAFYEAALRGNLYHASTAVTGVAPGTAIGTTAAFSLYNPASSGVNLVVLMATMGYVSGTLGAGVVNYVANTSPVATATSGTAITPVNAILGRGVGALGKPFTTATIPSPTVLGVFCSTGPLVATTAVQPWQIVDYVNGRIIVSPGCTLSLHSTAGAGTTPLVVFGIVWEETPVSP